MAAIEIHNQTKRIRPVTNPIRVVVIDPMPGARAALCRAIDLDRHLAVVGTTGDLGRAVGEAGFWAPEVVVIGLSFADSDCARLIADLEKAGIYSSVLVVGQGAGREPHSPLPLVQQVRTLGFAHRTGGEALAPTVASAPAPRTASAATLH
jgi:hypothetical protein